jgi:uncharacterized protein (DUF305 family)
MKKTFLIAGLCFTLIACNESGQQGANDNISDTASHSAQDGNTAGTGTNEGSGAGDRADQSMLSLMEKNMDQIKEVRSLGSSDKDFASMMKIHHMGATEMARMQVAQGTDQQVKDMAQRMINEQQREMQEFDAFLGRDDHNSTAQSQSSPFYDRVTKEMDKMKMGDLNDSGSVDQQFVQLMIPHHQGGVAMADLYLKTGAQDEKLKAIANRLKADQQKEIQQMQAWQANHK